MTFDIAAILVEDGIVNGAIYGLLAAALVLVFAVTRIVFVPQGDLVTFSAMTLAAFEAGRIPGTVWVLGAGALVALMLDLVPAVRERRFDLTRRPVLEFGVVPGAIIVLSTMVVGRESPLLWKMATTCALTTCFGPVLHRIVFQPLATASPLVLLIAAVAADLGLNSVGLHVFGAEGVRTTGFGSAPAVILGLSFTEQSLGVIGCSLALAAALFMFFKYALTGKALLAAAYNRRGAELVGISMNSAGRMTFAVAGFIGAVSGLLIGSTTTLYYDSGFVLALKGFVGAIVGGLASYPLAAGGALLVGVIESFASFWDSAYRDALVFTLIIPVLFWRSLAAPRIEDDAE
jgi:branched-chain amino acid transport system permease protein